MKGVHIDFTPQIRARVQASGQDIGGYTVAWLDQALNASLDLDPVTLRLGFALGAGRFGTLSQALDQLTHQPERIAA